MAPEKLVILDISYKLMMSNAEVGLHSKENSGPKAFVKLSFQDKGYILQSLLFTDLSKTFLLKVLTVGHLAA